MSDLLPFLLKHGYMVIFGASFLEQFGLPLPAVPLIVGMAALSRSGVFSFGIVVATALVASLAADLMWYELGRYYGRAVLRLICRISLEPDYCVRSTEDAFLRHGLWALLLAKFVPGLNAAAVPLAGMMRTPFLLFLVFDIGGLILWVGTYSGLGYVFSRQIERLISYLARLGVSLLIFLAVVLTTYVGYKIVQRRRFVKTLKVRRVTPEELKAKMDAKENVVIFDMRNPLDRKTDPVRIPGAFHVLPEHIEFQRQDISFDREIVIYCTCPNEATSARVALKLHRMGMIRAHPLEGGLDAWRERNLPVETLD